MTLSRLMSFLHASFCSYVDIMWLYIENSVNSIGGNIILTEQEGLTSQLRYHANMVPLCHFVLRKIKGASMIREAKIDKRSSLHQTPDSLKDSRPMRCLNTMPYMGFHFHRLWSRNGRDYHKCKEVPSLPLIMLEFSRECKIRTVVRSSPPP